MKTMTMAIMIFASLKSMLCSLAPFTLRDLKIILMLRTTMVRSGRKQVVVVGWNIYRVLHKICSRNVPCFHLVNDSESNNELLVYPLEKSSQVEKLWNVEADCGHEDRRQIPQEDARAALSGQTKVKWITLTQLWVQYWNITHLMGLAENSCGKQTA